MSHDLIVRIEPVNRAEDLRPGLSARLLDPLWLLARQWMVGEFDGEDAGTPVSADYTLAHYPLEMAAGPDGKVPLDTKPFAGLPLDAVLEAVPEPAGGWDARKRADTAALLARMLCDEEFDDAATTLFDAFRLPDDAWPAGVLPPPRAADGQAAYEDALAGKLADRLRAPAAEPVIALWQAVVAETLPTPIGSWRPERLGYTAELRCTGLAPTLHVDAHRGGGAGWMMADLDGPVAGTAPVTRREVRTPTALRFRGMPQARYWESEDATIDLGAVDAPAAELGRTALLQFALLYGNDAFLLPAALPAGGVSGVTSLQLSDTFGDVLGPVALAPATRSGPARGRGWALWAPEAAGAPQPWLFLPPPLAAPLTGDPLEEAVLVRDEMANRAWAIARTVTGPDGRRQHPDAAPAPAADAPTAASYRYRLATDVPPGWLPLTLDPDPAGRRLQRPAGDDGLLARLLPPGGWVFDEEVGREGVRLRIEPVHARAADGRTCTWMRIRRSAGRGGAASGLRYDAAVPSAHD